MIVILLDILTEREYVLNVILKRKENVDLKTLFYKRAKSQLELNGLVKELFYATNLIKFCLYNLSLKEFLTFIIIFERVDKIFKIKANMFINSLCLYYLFQKTHNYFFLKTWFKNLRNYKLSLQYWEIKCINNGTKKLL